MMGIMQKLKVQSICIIKFRKNDLKRFSKTVNNKIYKEMSGHPLIYILQNDNSFYIGETTSAIKRFKDHGRIQNKDPLITTFYNENFNQSIIKDVEGTLISLFFTSAENNNIKLENISSGNLKHFYPLIQQDVAQKALENI